MEKCSAVLPVDPLAVLHFDEPSNHDVRSIYASNICRW